MNEIKQKGGRMGGERGDNLWAAEILPKDLIQQVVVCLASVLHSMDFRRVCTLNGKMEEIGH